MIVALHGMLTSRNFGDVLLADLVATWLRSGGHEVVAPFAKPAVAQDLKIASPGGVAQLKQCEHLVFCGGGYFGLPPSRPVRKDVSMVARFASKATIANYFGIPYSMIGIGVSNLDRALLAPFMRRVFEQSNVLTVRDIEGKSALRKIGVIHSIEELSDLVLTLTLDQVPDHIIEKTNRDLLEFRGKFSTVIGLHISEPPTDQRYQAMFQGLDRLAESMPDAGFLLLEDHPAGPASGQRKAMVELARRIPGRTAVRPYQAHWDLVATISQLDGLITNKLHTAIVASALNRPAIAVAKHPKNRNFFQQIELSERCFDISGFDESTFIERSKSAFSYRQAGQIVPNHVRQRAMRNRTLIMASLSSLHPRG